MEVLLLLLLLLLVDDDDDLVEDLLADLLPGLLEDGPLAAVMVLPLELRVDRDKWHTRRRWYLL